LPAAVGVEPAAACPALEPAEPPPLVSSSPQSDKTGKAAIQHAYTIKRGSCVLDLDIRILLGSAAASAGPLHGKARRSGHATDECRTAYRVSLCALALHDAFGSVGATLGLPAHTGWPRVRVRATVMIA
jgi:hypothetical protein